MKKQNPARILIVDDNAHNVKRIEKVLRPQGYDIFTASGGQQAVEWVEETSLDLVVLDVLMPGMDGFDTARALRANPESQAIPILMVTALHEIEDRIKGLEAGADDFLSKPFNSVELLARVRSLLRIKHLHDELQTRNTLLERLLTRYTSPDITREILLNPGQDLRLDGQSCEVSALFARIQGFTRFSEEHKATQVTQALNYIYHHLAAAIFEHNGTLDKYLGDAIMAFYGAPVPSSDHPERALRSAWAMQRRFSQLCREDQALNGLGLRIGLSTGEAVVGNVGSERMMDYTIIGHTPNAAQRLQSHAQAGQILMDERTHLAVQEVVVARPVDVLNLNGHNRELRAFEVLAVKEPLKV